MSSAHEAMMPKVLQGSMEAKNSMRSASELKEAETECHCAFRWRSVGTVCSMSSTCLTADSSPNAISVTEETAAHPHPSASPGLIRQTQI